MIKKYGKIVRKIRKQLKLSQSQFGGMIGVSGFVIQNYELFRTMPRVDHYEKILKLERK